MKYCPTCCRSEDETDRCINKQGPMGCPPLRDAIPGQHIQVVCKKEGCERAFVLPVERVLSTSIPAEVRCLGLTPCGAKFIPITGATPGGKSGKAPKP